MSYTYFISGTSRGIGLAFVQQLLENNKNAIVIAGARNIDGEPLRALKRGYPDRLSLLNLDVSSTDSVKAAAEATKRAHPNGIDYLINNAAMIGEAESTEENFLKTYDTNVVGNLRMIQAFMPQVEKSQKKTVIGISSLAGSNTAVPFMGTSYVGKTPEPLFAYRVSKAAVNHLYACYAGEYKKRGILFVPIHPGLVETDMAKFSSSVGMESANNITPDESAQKILELAHKLQLEDTGKFFSYTGEVLGW